MKCIYNFDGKLRTEGNANMKKILGGKGANLAEMSVLGIPVPPGFTITTEVCNYYYQNNNNYPDSLQQQIEESIRLLEKTLNKKFGDSRNPLILSVRSGARISMPGMMDTILNLGLNDKSVLGIAEKTNNERFAYDSYRRFINMYADVVLGIDHYEFEEVLEQKKQKCKITSDRELNAEDLKEIVDLYKKIVLDKTGKEFEQDTTKQLWAAIEAVFRSWMNDRAITYRQLNDIPDTWGTAVNIQAMVFGNMGSDCATGVVFTRNPSTGNKALYGEYLVDAQGEDVVAGIRTPQLITVKQKEENNSKLPAMEEEMKPVYQELVETCGILEKHYKDMQDIEFTVQNHRLWLLQTRSGKRTTKATMKIAVDMVNEGLITREDALMSVQVSHLDKLLHPMVDPTAHKTVVASGLAASPGAASGAVVFSTEEVIARAKMNEKVILVRMETSPEDIGGMHMSEATLTSRGGMTSHAAVVARGMGKPCVVGTTQISIDYKNKQFKAGEIVVKENDIITINGSTGDVILGKVPMIQPELSDDFITIMGWSDEVKKLKIRVNAETVKDATNAVRFGAEGIGLCRSEHMFFEADRIQYVRQMIMADTPQERAEALGRLLPIQRKDFYGIFSVMGELPVTVRLLDPPLHEFLPHEQRDFDELARVLNKPVEQIVRRVAELRESNPMLGHRGCRLGISYPEIYSMQVEAILEAAIDVMQNRGISVIPEIMIPLVISKQEVDIISDLIRSTASNLFTKKGASIEYLIGTMIELPRAALNATEIAESVSFFSFGTNDLTQTTLGISRDDSGTFLNSYIDAGIFTSDPFAEIDVDGVGKLVKLAVDSGLQTNSNLKLGVCGEHGGDQKSIEFFHELGLDYVSCSPFRVSIARLAAAQAQIKARR